jgi:hypothetical protein
MRADLLVDNINPVNLKGLKQALFVLQSLEKGITAEQVSEQLDGDTQLVEIWTNFLIHNHWIQFSGSGYVISEKGREWLHRLMVLKK